MAKETRFWRSYSYELQENNQISKQKYKLRVCMGDCGWRWTHEDSCIYKQRYQKQGNSQGLSQSYETENPGKLLSSDPF